MLELLVASLVIGVLAAIALPSFFDLSGKADDAPAKDLANVAQVAAETYGTDHDGSYANLSPGVLRAYEAQIPTAPDGADAYVSAAAGGAAGYTVTVTPPHAPVTFTITSAGGIVRRTCASTTAPSAVPRPLPGASGGCVNGSW